MKQTETTGPAPAPQFERPVPRREFLANFAMIGGLFLGLGGLATRLIQFLLPADKPVSQQQILVGSEESLPLDRAQTLTIFSRRVIVVRTANGVHAFSGQCPHLGCNIQWDTTRRQFVCPCHVGIFDAEGQVVSGPPPRPLVAYEAVVENKNVYVTVPRS